MGRLLAKADEQGYLLTAEVAAHQADQLRNWNDPSQSDYAPLKSVDEHLARRKARLDESAGKSREIWVTKASFQSRWDTALATSLGRMGGDNRPLNQVLRSMIQKCGIVPDISAMIIRIEYHNLDGTLSVSRAGMGKVTSPGQARRAYLMHHGWDGKSAEPEWAKDIRTCVCYYTQTLDGKPRGTRWVVRPLPNPEEHISSYVDILPQVGDDGRWKWGGEPLVFDRERSITHGYRLSVAEFETAMVQGIAIAHDPIVNDLVGGPEVTLDLDEGLNWQSPDDIEPSDEREYSYFRSRWTTCDTGDGTRTCAHLSHDEQFFYELLVAMSAMGHDECMGYAEEMLTRDPDPDRMEVLYTPNGQGHILWIGAPATCQVRWKWDEQLRRKMLEAMRPEAWQEFKEYF